MDARCKIWGMLFSLLALLLALPGAARGGDAVRERAQANDAMNALRQAAAAGDASVPDALLAVARDAARDGGVREYAVQHLGAWMRAGHDAARVEQMLWELADDPVAGTAAILQLHHAGGPSLRGGRAWADLLARRMDRDGLRNAEKATLLLVAAESGVPAALPHARDWAAATSDIVLLRCALQTVGRLGSRADVAFLDRMAEEKPLGEATETWKKARRRLAEGPIP
ncbi:MAG: hypothetical protein IKQ55_00575 [Kiritimatiellae bacterium]|nr:hypothetical protein [Kiritimatiellia bacterium]